jgi:hypothetical protein
MSNRYLYLIAYKFNNGSGRTFYERETPIDSVEAVQAIEADIPKHSSDNLSLVMVNNIVLLREWSE